MKRLHLGCGSRILDGYINLDLEPKDGAERADLTKPLPYQNGEIDFIYSEHFIEHITRAQTASLLRECYRVLKPGGGIRICTPNLKELVKAYMESNLVRYYETGWLPKSPAQLLNEGMREWGHTFLYDEQELLLMMHEAGFKGIERMKPLGAYESRPDCNDLILAAVK